MASNLVLLNKTVSKWSWQLMAGILLATQAGFVSVASAQLAECTSCNRNLPCDKKIDEVFMNEDGKSASAYVRGCGAGTVDLPTKHATLISIPAGSNITHVCVGGRSTSQFTQPCEVFYANLDPLTGLPEIEQGQTQFGMTPGDNHHIVPVNWSLSGSYWIGVHYPAGACTLSEQGVRPRLTGEAAVWISGDAWRRYDFVGAAHYNGNTPIIRLISGISNTSPPLLVVNTIGGPPFITDESGSGFTFGVQLSREPCDTVFVNVDSMDPSEGVVTTQTPLQFNANNWNSPQAVMVAGVDDLVVDGDVPYSIEIRTASSLADYCYGGIVEVLSAINLDNDTVVANCPAAQPAWSVQTTAQAPPVAHHAMAYDSLRERVVLFGGEIGPGVFSGDTFEWDGIDWQLVAPAAAGTPTARVFHDMAYDANRGVTVLFGGIDAAGNTLDDTWEWNGATWQLVGSGPASPGGPRHEHAMAFDAQRGVTVLFGGLPPHPETWEWNGATWTPIPTPTVPGGGDRQMHAMTWNAGTQRVMLFGGIDINGIHNDQWEYDGFDWVPVLPISPTPQPVANAKLVYDTNRNSAILFGGDPLVFPETWEWDNNGVWIQLLPPSTPASTTFHAMAFDEARCTTVVFGGIVQPGGGLASAETYQFPDYSPASVRTFVVVGTATGADWSWAINDLAGIWSVQNQNTPGVVAGLGADVLVRRFVDSINGVGCCSVSASVHPQSPQVFDVTTTDPAGFDLCVGPVGPLQGCCVRPSVTCSFNPDIVEVFLSGVDCDGNGTDDAIDIAIDPSLDANGDGQIDSCATYIFGDLNCDLIVNGLDIQAFVLAEISPADYAVHYPNCNINAADMNGDGVINLLDRILFIQALL